MRLLHGAVLAAVFLCAGLLIGSFDAPAGPAQADPEPAESPLAVEAELGLTDSEPTAWNGWVRAEGARFVRLSGARLGDGMSVGEPPASWKCGTWWGPEPRQRPFDSHLPERPRPF